MPLLISRSQVPIELDIGHWVFSHLAGKHPIDNEMPNANPQYLRNSEAEFRPLLICPATPRPPSLNKLLSFICETDQLHIYLQPNSCFILKRTFYEKRYIPGHCRPDPSRNHCAHRPAGNDAERHCRQL